MTTLQTPVPSNAEAEEAVLGSLLIDPDAVQRVRSFLKPEHFYAERNAQVYRAIVDMAATGKPADFLTVCDELSERGQLDETSGPTRIMDLLNSVPTAIHVEYYA